MANDFRSLGNSYPRGLRNNNPTNLDTITPNWLGQVDSDGRFAVFENVALGIRAYLKNYYSSITKHKTATLSEYINRFAPPTENITSAYVKSVADTAGVDPNAPIPTDQETVTNIMKAQFAVELGKEYASMITDDDIAEGFSLLDSKLKTYFNAAVAVFNKYPVASYGTSAIVLIGISFLSIGIWERIRRKK